ncbi:MAG: NAD-dependent DNA ligase LigA [Bacteriovoracaceae bacterium]|nr:NAD-dependent DNA ligase LigA [Bacteriovoracaceae bacterium]
MERIKRLEEEILRHRALYYQGRSEISDNEYDLLEEELKSIDPNNYVFSIVGSELKGRGKVRHKAKMLSLNKTYDIDDLREWIGVDNVVSTYKIDGVSCSLIYQNGRLSMGKTRGDGTYGENITSKLMWIESIPKDLDGLTDTIEIRGELYCPEEKFFHLADEMEKIGQDRPSSQRNIVAGLMGRKENLELCRYISFQAFEYMAEELPFNSEHDKFKLMSNLGFETPNFILHTDNTRIEDAIEEAKVFMSEGDYQIDGLVFAYDELEKQRSLGETSHHPRYKMAFKFKGESKVTTIKKIIWSVSRNGVLTPVGNVEKIELSGARISRVTLHNFGMVRHYNLKHGDRIEIIRSGEVIPKFLSVVESSGEQFEYPSKCPECGAETIIEDIRLYCSNPNCSARIKEQILNFIQKIGIYDLSSKRLDALIESGMVKSTVDVYKLSIDDFKKMDKVKDKLAEKMHKSIQGTKHVDFVTFLASLGISGGAYNTCKKVVDAGFNSIEKISKLTVSELSLIDSFAEKSSEEFLKSFNEKLPLINELIGVGFLFKTHSSVEKPLDGKKICITGALSEKRSLIEKWIRDAGGVITGSVSNKTDYLLTNDQESNSSKFKKAKQFGVEIISEEKVKKMVNFL